MAKFNFKKILPLMIPLIIEVSRYLRPGITVPVKDKSHNQIATLENLLVRMERKVQENRMQVYKLKKLITVWLTINSVLLVAILVKLFFF
ncbi:MAG: hypothetical protein WC179_02510 [Candidatus Cloacimonadaceae bacterium]|jgi:hypothetical protein|nr:hypothetical protein [Candidatus Cloacimonadota bacterium]MCB5257723.1 hypothetical protein [Candidatus Cloacimonadota bacterium]MDD5625033.1 hypothetical protein [Candidatus Cloacimonadota bacterium]MDY0111433.1 hypothetical protein [Candidatus Syntrophosphaera sp.]